MNKFIADTMAVVLYLEHRKPPSTIKRIFKDAENGNAEIYIPVMVLIEIAYLNEKGKIEVSLEKTQQFLETNLSFKLIDITLEVTNSSFQISDIKELHDRIIAGTARSFNATLITNDPVIINSKFVETVWK